jgi:hypothetical protein
MVIAKHVQESASQTHKIQEVCSVLSLRASRSNLEVLFMSLVLALCSMSIVSAGTEPYKEFLTLHEKPRFLYEQTEVPVELRPFFIPLALAREEIGSNVAWSDRMIKLLHGFRVPSSWHYVSPEHAHNTYVDVRVMAQRMKIEAPLLFLTGKHNTVKTIQAISLAGNFYGLVCNRSFLKRRTAEECRVLVAHELARIAQRKCHTPKLAKKIWLGAVLTIVAAVLVRHMYKTATSPNNLKEKAAKFSKPFIEFVKANWWWYLGSTALVFGSKIGAEFIGAYLSRKYQHEADMLAIKGFGHSPDAYLDALRIVETEEGVLRQKMQYQYKKHYAYVADKIDALTESVHPYIVCFLKNELGRHNMKETDRPAVAQKTTSLLHMGSSLDDRIAYVYDNLRSKKNKKN